MSNPTRSPDTVSPLPGDHLPEVKAQYELLPYPPCNPKDEKKRLVRTWLEDLPMINHYCFAGKQTFREGFRALVAGGGTGDATIFLAEQLKATDAHIVHLDFSQASTAIARERAAVRGLTNITFIVDSILNIPAHPLAPFDYINCSGVLHHLADPDAGLRALRSVLKPDGALGIMLYGKVGRTGVYQMQTLLQLMNAGQTDVRARIDTAKQVLKALPATNWFKRGEDLYFDHKYGDAGIYDLLLHSQDRGYTVDELFDWFDTGHGLHLSFSDVQRGRSPYLPELVLGGAQATLLQTLAPLPRRKQYAIAELAGGTLAMHSFYATASAAAVAPYGELDSVPFYFHEPLNGAMMEKTFNQRGGKPFLLQHAHSGVATTVDPGRYGPLVLRHIDGRTSFRDIFARVRAEPKLAKSPPDDATLFADFRPVYEVLNAIDRLLLRHVSTTEAG